MSGGSARTVKRSRNRQHCGCSRAEQNLGCGTILVGFWGGGPNSPLEAASKVFSKDVFVPEDKLEKLRSNLVHAYDKPKPLTRRIIEAIKNRTGAPKEPIRSDSGTC